MLLLQLAENMSVVQAENKHCLLKFVQLDVSFANSTLQVFAAVWTQTLDYDQRDLKFIILFLWHF